MADRTCVRCGDSYEPQHGRQRYCTKRCQKRGEVERYRAKRVPMDCAHCGQEFMGRRWCDSDAEHKRRYCSRSCEYEAKSWRYRTVFSRRLPWRECDGCGGRFLGRNGTRSCDGCRTRRRCWFMGYCVVCEAPFVTEQPAQRCCSSSTCGRRLGRDLRRARLRASLVDRVRRQTVYERDGWMCRLCEQPVDRDAVVPDPQAPTLDHILPLALGGDHSYANVQCAHYLCNSRKGATADAQLRLAA